MDKLSEVFKITTNPDTPYSILLSKPVMTSILLHTVVYTCVIRIFFPSYFPETIWILRTLLPVMILGYVGRLYRAKSLANLYSREEVKHLMNSAYFVWYFLG